MLRFLSGLGWTVVVAILAGFVWFAIEISEPVEGTLRGDLVTGTVRPAPVLAPEGPFLGYVALHRGRPADELPEHPLDDQIPETDGSFALSADAIEGTRFFLLARIETAQEELYCRLIPLPEMRFTGDGWVARATGRPLLPRHVVVGKARRCSY